MYQTMPTIWTRDISPGSAKGLGSAWVSFELSEAVDLLVVISEAVVGQGECGRFMLDEVWAAGAREMQ